MLRHGKKISKHKPGNKIWKRVFLTEERDPNIQGMLFLDEMMNGQTGKFCWVNHSS